MALEATVTKLPVILGGRNMITFGVNLTVTDDSVEVLNENITLERPKSSSPVAAADDLLAAVQERIDKYKTEQTVFNHAQYDVLVSTVQSGLEV